MNIDINLLKNNTMFPPMDDDILRSFLDTAVHKTFEDGEVVFTEMGTFDEIMMVLEGSLNRVIALLPEASETDELIMVRPGEFSNAVQLIGETSNASTCIAVGKVQVLAWKAETWRTICEEHPEVGYNLVSIVSRQLVSRLLQINQYILDNVSWGLE